MVMLADRYEIQRPVGSGGMARVVAGYDHALDRPVAIKLIRDELVGDRAMRERLLREARGAAGLQHPNTVAVHDVGEHDGVPFIVMEFVDGSTLAEVLGSEGRLSPDRTFAIVSGVLAGLGAAHERGLIHRDVKPSNILLPAAGGVKLTDFGIARELGGSAARLTDTGQLLGTPRYAAPEQAMGRTVTPASDVYSVGVVAYECLAGRPPFGAETPIGMVIAHEREPVPPLASAVAGLDPGVADVIERSLAKDPGARFDDAATMLRALRTVMPAGHGQASVEESVPAGIAGSVATGEDPADATSPIEATAVADAAAGDPATRPYTLGGTSVEVPHTDTTRSLRNDRPSTRSGWSFAFAVVAVGLLGVLALLTLTDGPVGRNAFGHKSTGDIDHAIDAPATTDDDAEDLPGAAPASDLEGLIAVLAEDADAAGDKGQDLLDDLRELAAENDAQRRRRAARDVIIDVAGWIVDGEIDADLGRDAIWILEAEGRPSDPQLADASTLFADVAAHLDEWGTRAHDLVDDLDDLLDISAPGRISRDARELAADVEGWIGAGELDREHGSSALEVLHRLDRRR